MSAPAAPGRDASWFGHPRGLSTMFFTEMWERFSYYGMRAFLILYMVHVLGFDKAHAGHVYGLYTGSVWGMAVFGGIVADNWLGQYRSVLVGGIIIALGHFTLAFHPLPFFYAGLTLIVIGTGLLKPNVSGIVGALYDEQDQRRDAGFSIFYMGINTGAILGPLIADTIAEKVDWHLGFACAGVGMTLGLWQYVAGRERIRPAIERLSRKVRPKEAVTVTGAPAFLGLSVVEWKRIAAMGVFFVCAIVFWFGYEQAGSSLNLLGDQYTNRTVFGFTFPAGWFVTVQSFCVVIFAPIFAWMWVRLGKREPSTPTKFAIGVGFVGLSYLLLLIPGGALHANPDFRISLWWLVGCYAIQELGELCLSPVGLSVFTKLSPVRIVGMMLGLWFLADAIGNWLAGYAAAYMTPSAMPGLFLAVALICLGWAVIALILTPVVKRLMGGVH